jgi:hypothetical protein
MALSIEVASTLCQPEWISVDGTLGESGLGASESSFVKVHIPLRVLGDGPKRGAIFQYDLGPFSSREIHVTMEADHRIDLRFRLPKELFRSPEQVLLEVFSLDDTSAKNVKWSARYELCWQGETPHLEPLAK